MIYAKAADETAYRRGGCDVQEKCAPRAWEEISLAGARFPRLRFFHPMLRIPLTSPAELDAARISAHRRPNAAAAAPDSFSASPPSLPVIPPQATSSRAGLWSSISLRFSGFSAHLEALVEPVGSLRTPAIARVYFSEKLPELAGLAAKNPVAARRIITEKAPVGAHLWRDLLLVATGDAAAMDRARVSLASASRIDAAAIAHCCLAVARHEPHAGRELLAHTFAHASAAGQVAILGALTLHQDPAPPVLLGELFVSMMKGSTPEDRTEVIYPALSRLIALQTGKRSSRVGFLSALFRGWLSECPKGKEFQERLEG